MKQNIFMVGIGGVGMSALAQLYTHEGHDVSGSDRGTSPTTELLQKKGVHIYQVQEAGNVTDTYHFLVYSDAIPFNSEERVKAREIGIPEYSYFEALGIVAKNKKVIAIAGTHGKTTTTAMIAKILIDAQKSPTVVVGSIVRDFDSNFVAGSSDLLVVEACEYRDHLLQLYPHLLLITNIELDHTDYFPNLESMQQTFQKAILQVKKDGCVVTNTSDESIKVVTHNTRVPVLDFSAEFVPELKQIGTFNKENAKAAKKVVKALCPDISEAGIDASLASFVGTWRRFEEKGKMAHGALVFDDYAHHPTAVRETIRGVRERFPQKRIIVAFHPHTYSRTRDFMDDFAEAFSQADEVIVAPIFSAREPAIEGITSAVLSDKIKLLGTPAQASTSFEDVAQYIKSIDSEGAIVITMGAGDIYKVADMIVERS